MGKKKRNKKRTNRTELERIQTQIQPSQNHKQSPIALKRQQITFEAYSGPIPTPDMLQKYEEVVHGSAQTIMNQFREQSEHRRWLEKKVVGSDILRSYIGLLCGFVTGIAGLSIAAYLIINGYPIAGSIFGGGTLVSLVSVFIYGTRTKREELEKKQLAATSLLRKR